MSETTAPRDQDPNAAKKRRRRLIISIIVVSVAVHLIFGGFAAIWVIARYFEKPKAQFTVEKVIRIDPEDRQHQISMQDLDSLRPRPVFNNRIASLRPTELSLPDLPKLPVEKSVPLDTDALVNDQIDSLSSARSGQGLGGSGGFFGGIQAIESSFRGVFTDYKLLADGTPSGIRATRKDQPQYEKLLAEFILSPDRDLSILEKYKMGDNQLYRTYFVTPGMGSKNAPKQFGAPDSEDGFWLAYYKTTIRPPEDGDYRFFGHADNLIVVLIDGKNAVSDHTSGYDFVKELPTYWRRGDSRTKQLADRPKSTGKYTGGPWIRLQRSKTYQMEVFIGDDGGTCYARLLVQKRGDKDAVVFQTGEVGGEAETELRKVVPNVPVNQSIFEATVSGAAKPTSIFD
jgi:hypothetical protein